MKKLITIILGITLFISCQKSTWKFEKKIALPNIHPIGITTLNDTVWLSDGNGNRLVAISNEGELIKEIKGFERPMHISSFENSILVPEYGRDSIAVIRPSDKNSYLKTSRLDAPASVHKVGTAIAVADFYNHKIAFFNGDKWINIGQKGSEKGAFNYPTDVQIVGNKIYVADAYNHRVQLFNFKGDFLEVLAENQNINAATGIYVTNKEVYVTDFENNRVLKLNQKGELLQELQDSIQNPTDILVHQHKLWVLNFKEGSVSLYTR